MSRTYRHGWKPTCSDAKKLANRKLRAILKEFDKKNGGIFPDGCAYKNITKMSYDIVDYGGGWCHTPDAQWMDSHFDKHRGCVFPDGKWEIGHDEIESPNEVMWRWSSRPRIYRVSRPYSPSDHKRCGKIKKKMEKMAFEKGLDELD